MDNDLIKESISNLKPVRNNFWTAILLTSGGTVTLALNENVFILLKYSFIIVGILLLVIFILIYRSINNDINVYIKKLEIEKGK